MTLMIDDLPLTGRPAARPRPRLAKGRPVRMPVLDGPSAHQVWLVAAFLLGAIETADLRGPTRSERHGLALTHGETRVLRYLPTYLSAREIADELFVSVNTVKTHKRHLYQKLGARSRSQAVERARVLGLLAPSARRPRAGGEET
ncbi:MAG: response regulator transcription factor [Streptosporangiaceae bacterium]